MCRIYYFDPINNYILIISMVVRIIGIKIPGAKIEASAQHPSNMSIIYIFCKKTL